MGSHDSHMIHHFSEDGEGIGHSLLSVHWPGVQVVQYLLIDMVAKPQALQLRHHHHQLCQSWG